MIAALLDFVRGLASPGRWLMLVGLAGIVAGLAMGAHWIYNQGEAAGIESAAKTVRTLQDQLTGYTAAWAADSAATAKKEQTHAADTIHASDAYAAGAPEREARLRADLADARRLRDAADVRAAGYRAQANAGAEACRGLADRSAALDRSLAAGRGVVAELRGALERRDAEVALLAGLIDADDALLAPGAAP
jgi:hypothetical protein